MGGFSQLQSMAKGGRCQCEARDIFSNDLSVIFFAETVVTHTLM